MSNTLAHIFRNLQTSNDDVLTKLNAMFTGVNQMTGDELVPAYQAAKAYEENLLSNDQFKKLAESLVEAIKQRMRNVARAQFAIIDNQNFKAIFAEVTGDESFRALKR
jgi:hypothetical protein